MIEAQTALMKSERPLGTVDGDNFPSFLMGEPVLIGHQQRFTKRLDLTDSVPIQNMLYKASRQGYVLPNETRVMLIADAENELLQGRDKSAQSLFEYANRTGEVERVSTMYMSGDLRLKYTEPEFGDHTSVTPKAYLELIKEGCMPLMDFHTHPQDVLPSPEDNTMLITGIIKGSPFYRARMVLCPNVQILAIADRNTVLFEQNRALEILKYYKEDNIYGEEFEEVMRRQEAVIGLQQRFQRSAEKILKRGLSTMTDNANFYLQGTLTMEEIKRMTTLDQRFRTEQNKKIIKLVKPMMAREAEHYSNFEQYARNKGHLQMLRNFNIKLYISDDMHNFYAFTA